MRILSIKYVGKLAVCPYDYWVVLANITRARLDKSFPLGAQELLFPPHLMICQDEMTDKAEAKKGINEKVQVYHFHDWCGEQLKTYHVDVKEASEEKPEPIWERQVRR